MTYPKQNVTRWEGSVKSKRFPLQWIYLNIHFGIWDLPICGLRKGNPNPKRKTVLTVATRVGLAIIANYITFLFFDCNGHFEM